jgi:hypothetical protein
MALSSPFSETYTIPRKAASAAQNLIRDIQNEENMTSSVNKSKDDAAPAAAPPAVDAVKVKNGSRNKEVATTTQTVVTVELSTSSTF